jgi:hypothetical protein
MAVLRIERGRLELLAVADAIESHADQKNWMPVVRSGELDLVVRGVSRRRAAEFS